VKHDKIVEIDGAYYLGDYYIIDGDVYVSTEEKFTWRDVFRANISHTDEILSFNSNEITWIKCFDVPGQPHGQ
jgi:hypothetical protein